MNLVRYLLPSLFDVHKEQAHLLSVAYWTTDSGITAISTLIGAIVGALVAGVIQYAVSKGEHRRNRAIAAEDRKDAQRAIALRIMSKTFSITNQLHSIMSTMLTSLEEAKAGGNEHFALWQRLQPVSSLPAHPTRIDDDEIALLFAVSLSGEANELLMLSEKFYSTIEAVRLFNERRTLLTDQMPARMAGPVGTTYLKHDEYQRLAPRMYELQDIALQIRVAIMEDLEYAMEIAKKIGPSFKDYFGDKLFPKAEFKEQVQERLERFRELSVEVHLLTIDPSAFQTSAMIRRSGT